MLRNFWKAGGLGLVPENFLKHHLVFFRLKRPPRDLPTTRPYVVFYAESDFEGPRALGPQFWVVLVVFLVFVGYL